MIRDDLVYLAHIMDALEQIRTYTNGMDDEAFRANRMDRTQLYDSLRLSVKRPRIFQTVLGKITLGCPGRISQDSVIN